MYPFSGLDGGNYSSQKLPDIERDDGQHVTDEPVTDGENVKKEQYRPGKGNRVDDKQGELLEQGLRAMPLDKIRRSSIGNTEYKRGNEVHNG